MNYSIPKLSACKSIFDCRAQVVANYTETYMLMCLAYLIFNEMVDGY